MPSRQTSSIEASQLFIATNTAFISHSFGHNKTKDENLSDVQKGLVQSNVGETNPYTEVKVVGGRSHPTN